MSAFDRLHPAVQHHVVNSLGWRSLRPVQEAAAEALLDGADILVQAPTAGGKTEAAILPLLSATLTGGWSGTSVLYVCPVKALLNNQAERLGRYYALVGRRAAVRHGDVTAAGRRRLAEDPPDCLLTTPESLEVMLVSGAVGLLAGVRAVVVDEVHALAGDDRGWHLLCVLARIARLSGRDLQRVGLSATVGNPEELLAWLAGGSPRPRRVVRQESSTGPPVPEVTVDYVGSLHNAARVVAALHRGEKRLVFCDSRARVEQLAAELRSLDVTTFVTHSSLGLDERRRAEEAFSQGRDCVIAATSSLELGVDVGDLDRVVQVDAPATVSSFLQRMGRTGRRPGTSRNTLFLATDEEPLLRAAALVSLWRRGFVEPAVPPQRPLHILAQQLMALCLQEGGLPRGEAIRRAEAMPAFGDLPRGAVASVLDGMLERGILRDDAGVLWLGGRGEEEYGRRHFLELFSVFSSPAVFAVLHGRHELGSVHESTFLAQREGPVVLLLGGRSWRVRELDRPRRRAWVEPFEGGGRSRWLGCGPSAALPVCREVRGVLCGDGDASEWSQRARTKMAELRAAHPWVRRDATTLVLTGGRATWWTFAGLRANASLARALGGRLGLKTAFDNFSVGLGDDAPAADVLAEAIRSLAGATAAELSPQLPPKAVEDLKFSECLSEAAAADVLTARVADPAGAAAVLAEPLTIAVVGDPV